MKKFILLFFSISFLCMQLIAQSSIPSRTTIKGTVIDTTGSTVPAATIMLLNTKDSSLVNFTRTDDKGYFTFNNVRNIPYLLKVSYIGFLPSQQTTNISATEENNLGQIKIKPISQTLMEVVIKAARAPLLIHGDTIEYNTASFKVPPGSTVEDLLRRLPGIDVDADGNIKSQGKDVKKVYVDGKTFFGDDPKSATKNLGAEAISKVQVFNEKSEQAKLTGIDDGQKNKAMNLALKEDFKKGAFGKATLAGGTSERWAARGNYNRFSEKTQLSFIGFGNNVNQTGVNWEDYSEFKGKNTFDMFDNGDFGFSGSGGMSITIGGDNGSGLTNQYDGRGYTKNYGGGMNYNFTNKTKKFNASYIYNQTKLNIDEYAFRQTFLKDYSLTNNDTSGVSSFRNTHSLGSRYEQDIDSNNRIIVKANLRFSGSDATTLKSQFFTDSDMIPVNRLSTNDKNNLNAISVNSAAIYRHLFAKKGRSFSMSAGYNLNRNDGTQDLFNLNKFFNATTFTDQVRMLNSNNNDYSQVKSSMLYIEPLAKKWYWQSFYNFSYTLNDVNRQVDNGLADNVRIDSLSMFYTNHKLLNRLGTSIRYSNKGLNVSLGVAAQQLQLKGKYSTDRNLPQIGPTINKYYSNLLPNLSTNYQITDNSQASLNYSFSVNEPQLTDLQPIPIVSNPLFLAQGNPDLKPEGVHSINMSYNSWNGASFAFTSFSLGYSRYVNQIVYNQVIEPVENLGIRTTTKPANISGGNNYYANAWTNFPIIKTKLTFNLSLNGQITTTPVYINQELDNTRSKNFLLGMNLSFTPSTKLTLGINGSSTFNNISYSIRADQDQKIRNYSLRSSGKLQIAKKAFLESDFGYTVYRNNRYDFNQTLPIWNASVRQLLGKKNRFEMRLAAFDILDKGKSIVQNATQNYVQRTISNTLTRYIMLSISYNLKGFETSAKRKQMIIIG